MKRINFFVIFLFLFFCTQGVAAEEFQLISGYEIRINDFGVFSLPETPNFSILEGANLKLTLDKEIERIFILLTFPQGPQGLEFWYRCAPDLLMSQDFQYAICILETSFGANYHALISLKDERLDILYIHTNGDRKLEIEGVQYQYWYEMGHVSSVTDTNWKQIPLGKIPTGKYHIQGMIYDGEAHRWETFYGKIRVENTSWQWEVILKKQDVSITSNADILQGIEGLEIFMDEKFLFLRSEIFILQAIKIE